VERIFSTYETDITGQLSFNQVTKYIKQRCPHAPDESIFATLGQIDINNNGKIDKNEML